MDVYMTIYRGETAEDETEINIEGYFDMNDGSLEIHTVVDSFNDKPIKLTSEERHQVGTAEFDSWLESKVFFDGSLSDHIGQHRKVYWAANNVIVVDVEEYEATNDAMDRLSEALNPVGGE